MDCTHPDIRDFITIKSDLNQVTKANISVKVTDEFMKAAIERRDITLSFTCEDGTVITKEENAGELLDLLSETNWNYAEPGMMFWDTANRNNLQSHVPGFHYDGVNPCGEEYLMAEQSCLLGSINLAEYVKDHKFDMESFRADIPLYVEALDTVLEEGIDYLPLGGQRKIAREYRAIGLGVFGVADMLIRCRIRYGSQESIELLGWIGANLAERAIYQSAMLAKRNGVYPAYKQSAINSTFFKHLMESKYLIGSTLEALEKAVKTYGLRNCQLLTIPPTGSIGPV